MLEVGSFLLKFVVIVLEHLDELLVVLNALLVVQLDRLQRNAIIVWNISHASQLSVLSREVVNKVGEGVDLSHQRRDLLVLLLFLLA